MANSEWLSEFPTFETFLDIGESDQKPIVTYISYDNNEPKKVFRYGNRMNRKEGFKDFVRCGWKGT